MNTPAVGLGLLLWLRLRIVVTGIAMYIAALAVAVQLFPLPPAMFIGIIGTLALSAIAAHVLTVFTFGPADLGVRGSGFPKNMMVLPLRTKSLVCWPMVYGAGTMAALWILVATLILRPAGLPVPVLWPAAVGAACTAWLQAIGWSPFPSPFARVPALALALTPLILLGICAGLYLESQGVSILIAAASVVWIFVAYLFGVQGLARARAGSEGEWLRVILDRRVARIRRRYVGATSLQPRFGSPFTAQLWHECRRNAAALPIMFMFFGLPIALLSWQTVISATARETYIIGSIPLSPSLVGLLFLVLSVPMMCGLYGPGLGKFDIWGKEQMPAFFAIRPMTTSRFVLIKMTAAAIGTLAVWGIMLLLISVWALLEASPLNPRESIVRAALADASPRQLAIFFAVLFGLLAFSCREVMSGMWPSLTGRKWFANTLGFSMIILVGIAVAGGGWVYRHPEVRPHLMAWIPWLMGTLLAVKLVAAAWIFYAIRQHRLFSWRTAKIWIGGWVAGCVILFALLSFFVTPSPMLAAGVVLLMPLTRLAAAPLALHWNRHR